MTRLQDFKEFRNDAAAIILQSWLSASTAVCEPERDRKQKRLIASPSVRRVSILYSAVTSGSFLRAPPGPAGSGARGETTCQTRRNTWCLPEPLNLPQVDACSGNCRLTRSTGEHRVTVTTAVSVSGGGATAELQQRHRALKAKVTIEEK